MGGAARLRESKFRVLRTCAPGIVLQGLRVHDGKKLLWLCMLSTNLDTGLPPSSVPRHTVGAVASSIELKAFMCPRRGLKMLGCCACQKKP